MTPKRKRRAEQERVYKEIIFKYLSDNEYCAVCGFRSETVHHRAGRMGDLLIDPYYFLPVCALCHAKIHKYPKWSYEKGYLIKRNSK